MTTLMPFPYADVFEKLEHTLIAEGSTRLEPDVVRRELDYFKGFADVRLSDTQYYETLVMVTFYSGFRAATVTGKRGIILSHFPDWETVSVYSEAVVERISTDPSMIRHRRKIQACVVNARKFRSIVGTFGSIREWIDSFGPSDSPESLRRLKASLESNFAYLGGITVYHFLTDIGFPVLKPDRVITRLFARLGLIQDEKQHLEAVIQGQKFAQATGQPMRYIDIVLVAHGQVSSPEFGIERGICLTNPRCDACSIQSHCTFRNGASPADAA